MNLFDDKLLNQYFDYIRGTRQVDRQNQALDADYFKVNEKSIPDLLNYLERLSSNINYYNYRDEKDGNWSRFFHSDKLFVLSNIASIRVRKIFLEYYLLKRNLNHLEEPDEWIDHYSTLYEYVVSFAESTTNWYGILIENVSAAEIKMKVELAGSKLAESSAKLQEVSPEKLFGNASESIKKIQQSLDSFFRMLGISRLDLKPPQQKISGIAIKKRVSESLKTVDEQFKEFRKTAIYIVQLAQEELNEALDFKADHEPHVGLLVAFLKLLDYPKARMNEITKRHLDFYYYDILKQEKLKATPDQVFIIFKLIESLSQFFLRGDTMLEAGKDNHDRDILYSTDQDIWLNGIEIAALKSVYLNKSPLISDADPELGLTANQIYVAPVANSKDGLGEPLDERGDSWPALGEDQADLDESERTMIDGRIGLLISSPILAQREGERKIELILQYQDSTESDDSMTFQAFIENFQKGLKRSEGKDLSAEEAFALLMSNAFNVSFTSEEGWITLLQDQVKISQYDEIPNSIRIEFLLARDEPSINVYNAEVHTYAFTDPWPIVRLELNNNSEFPSFAALKDLIITNITINVDVRGARNVYAKSSIGELDIRDPFQPFGTIPKLGSYFSIGKPEVINKYLTNISFNIEWMGLPLHQGGFKEFFKPYGLEHISNDSFKVRISALAGNIYKPDEQTRQEFSLFQSKDLLSANKDHSISDKSTIGYMPGNHTGKGYGDDISDLHEGAVDEGTKAIDVVKLDLRNMPRIVQNDEQEINPNSGYLRFELSAPSTAFGHGLFPRAFSSAAMMNAKNSAKGLVSGFIASITGREEEEEADQITLPEEPYSPTIKSFLIDYTMSMSENLSTDTKRLEENQGIHLRHIHPFGVVRFYPKTEGFVNYLLPRLDEEGVLLIGLTGLNAPQTLTLFFKLVNSKIYQTKLDSPELKWSYLANNVWHDFSKKQIISDSTNNLVKDGIIKIEIPSEINLDNTMLSSDHYWIKVSANGPVNVKSRIQAIHTNVVIASRAITEDGDQLHKQVLPANTIKGFVETISEVADIQQPFSSFGGEPGENEDQFYLRVSERLNHKDRALTKLDFERMVLEKFPQIMMAKCIGSVYANRQFHPGVNVQMIVIPHPSEFTDQKFRIPSVDYRTLFDIKKFLAGKTSASVHLELGNPIYEIVKVICRVRFKDQENRGFFIQKLNEDLRKFISPWTFYEDAVLDLGGVINKSDIKSFIEFRSYVESVDRFTVVHIHDLENVPEGRNLKSLVNTSQVDKLAKQFLHKISEEERYQPDEYKQLNILLIVARLVFDNEGSRDLYIEELKGELMAQIGARITKFQEQGPDGTLVFYRSEILDFVRDRSFVKEILEFGVFDLVASNDSSSNGPVPNPVVTRNLVDQIRASKPNSILISANRHNFDAESDADEEYSASCIGSMVIGEDLILQENELETGMVIKHEFTVEDYPAPTESHSSPDVKYKLVINPEIEIQ